ncbi:MAG: hypothetical protein MHPSP_000054, partial [Paramarteilia canceri]
MSNYKNRITLDDETKQKLEKKLSLSFYVAPKRSLKGFKDDIFDRFWIVSSKKYFGTAQKIDSLMMPQLEESIINLFELFMTSNILLISGNFGYGKTYLVKRIKNYCNKIDKKIVVLYLKKKNYNPKEVLHKILKLIIFKYGFDKDIDERIKFYSILYSLEKLSLEEFEKLILETICNMGIEILAIDNIDKSDYESFKVISNIVSTQKLPVVLSYTPETISPNFRNFISLNKNKIINYSLKPIDTNECDRFVQGITKVCHVSQNILQNISDVDIQDYKSLKRHLSLMIESKTISVNYSKNSLENFFMNSNEFSFIED